MNDLEEQYGFGKELAELTDEHLVERFNHQVGQRGWGNARSYLLACLGAEIKSRAFDSSAIFHETGMSLSRRANLVGTKLVLVEE